MQYAPVVAAIVVIVIVGLILALVMRRPRLRSLPDDARRRYAVQWRAIETRFIDQPREAVREADALALAVIRERGGRAEHGKLPSELKEARAARDHDGEADTEGLRRAMQRYQAVIDDAIGKRTRESAERSRPEVA